MDSTHEGDNALTRHARRAAALPGYGQNGCGVLSACEALHGHLKKSRKIDNAPQLAEFLQVCLETWSPSVVGHGHYDNCVALLIRAVLIEDFADRSGTNVRGRPNKSGGK